MGRMGSPIMEPVVWLNRTAPGSQRRKPDRPAQPSSAGAEPRNYVAGTEKQACLAPSYQPLCPLLGRELEACFARGRITLLHSSANSITDSVLKSIERANGQTCLSL